MLKLLAHFCSQDVWKCFYLETSLLTLKESSVQELLRMHCQILQHANLVGHGATNVWNGQYAYLAQS